MSSLLENGNVYHTLRTLHSNSEVAFNSNGDEQIHEPEFRMLRTTSRPLKYTLLRIHPLQWYTILLTQMSR